MQNEAESILNLLHEGQDEIKQRIPDVMENFQNFSQSVIKEGLLTPIMKELIATAVSVSIRCQP
ncbi:MAG TPA: carboxymuconolactone decarboxylase family protein [Syntrophomonadaceae bacterium]|nr:carboxymuconolactone decarboxylase family protein [Syntrophomonadaceae bacterium]